MIKALAKILAPGAAAGACVCLFAASGIATGYVLHRTTLPTSTLPTVITTTADCDILRGVDQGHRYYVADCRPDRLYRRGVME